MRVAAGVPAGKVAIVGADLWAGSAPNGQFAARMAAAHTEIAAAPRSSSGSAALYVAAFAILAAGGAGAFVTGRRRTPRRR